MYRIHGALLQALQVHVGHLGPAPVVLGTAGTFRVLAGSTITNTGVTTSVDGDAGVFPGSAVVGLTG